MVVTAPVTVSATQDDQAVNAGVRCVKYVRDHFNARPKATGLASHDYRPSDVIVTTFPKSGTTLAQHMSYQIVALSGGGPDFDKTGLDFPDLAIVSPWLEHIPNIGIKPCETTPRVLKTHMSVANFAPVKSKHIVVVRNFTAYPASWLDFTFDAIVPDAEHVGDKVREAAFHECVRQDLLTPVDAELNAGMWHKFVKESVFPADENILVLFYEDVVKNMVATVKRVAKFMGCKLTHENAEEVVRRCDRDTMGSDPRFFCRIENKCFGVTKDQPKARKASAGGFKKFSLKPEDKAQLEDVTERLFGVRTYAELKEMINKRQQEQFGH